jgi:hypothetical protein
MQKKILIFIFCIIFVSGCGSFFSNKGPISDVNFRTGTSALEMEFLKENPPNDIYENQNFKAAVFLQNKGASGIKKGYLVIGIEEDYMELLYERYGKKIDLQLEGKSMQNPAGEEKIEEFVLKAKKIDPQTQEHESSIYITSCYGYRTELSETVCIDTDVYNLKPMEKVCTVKDISLSSQGAPVAVTKIEERISSSDNGEIIIPEFTIYIDNKGKGEVIDASKIDDACSSGSLNSEDINKLKISAYLSGIPLECNSNELKLKNKQDKVICSLKEGVKKDEPAFTTLLSVIIEYGYTQTISKKITIKKSY